MVATYDAQFANGTLDPWAVLGLHADDPTITVCGITLHMRKVVIKHVFERSQRETGNYPPRVPGPTLIVIPTSRNPYINGTSIYRFVPGMYLCIRCGDLGNHVGKNSYRSGSGKEGSDIFRGGNSSNSKKDLSHRWDLLALLAIEGSQPAPRTSGFVASQQDLYLKPALFSLN